MPNHAAANRLSHAGVNAAPRRLLTAALMAYGDKTPRCQRAWILPHTVEGSQVDDAALIPKDPRRPPASQQTYSQVVEKGSRCGVAIRANRIDLDATTVVPDNGQIVFENPHWTVRRATVHIIEERRGTPGRPVSFAKPPMAQRGICCLKSQTLVSTTPHSSCRNVETEESRIGIAPGPAHPHAAGFVFLQVDTAVTLERGSDGTDLRWQRLHS